MVLFNKKQFKFIKVMKKQIVINYNWNCDQGIEIPEKHNEALIEDAEEKIFEMIKLGYFEGELSTLVRYGKDIVPEENEDEGLTYSGYWNVKLYSKI